jgi:hypothetical protein
LTIATTIAIDRLTIAINRATTDQHREETPMSVSLKVWTAPATGEVRIYANVMYERSEFSALSGARAYFVADENGNVKIGGFQTSWSGEYGRAAQAAFEAFRMDGVSFIDMIARIEAAQTPGGNFSETRYFNNLKADA